MWGAGTRWLVVFVACLAEIPGQQASRAAVLTGQVTTVVDGDTIKVTSRGFETTVRLIGVDTPETRKPTG